jgi:hypothetical protein
VVSVGTFGEHQGRHAGWAFRGGRAHGRPVTGRRTVLPARAMPVSVVRP